MFNEPPSMEEQFIANSNYIKAQYDLIKNKEIERSEVVTQGFMMLKKTISYNIGPVNCLNQQPLNVFEMDMKEEEVIPLEKPNINEDLEIISNKQTKKQKKVKKKKYFAIKTAQNYHIQTEF